VSWIISAAHAATVALGTLSVGTALPGASNTITLSDVSGSGETNYPFQFGRPFLQGVIPAGQCPQVVGMLSQSDVKNRYPDGSVEFAVIAVVIPAIPASGNVLLTFTPGPCANTPLTTAQMQSLLPVGGMTMTLTPTTGPVGSADAGQMLADGNCQLWTSGQVAQTVMCADDTAARKYDIGFGDGYHPFRPRFYATFWPTTQQVYIRVVGENGLTTEQEDIAYVLSIASSGNVLYTKDLSGVPTGSPTKYPLVHWADTRWTREFWLGGTPQQQVNIDNNLPYLTSARFLPNLDPTVTISPASITSNYATYIAATHDIYDGAWTGGNPFKWINAMGEAGDSGHIGPFPLVISMWLHTPDWRIRYMAMNQIDLAAAWPLDYRESDPARHFQRGDTAGTGLGRAVSAAGRPQMWNGADNPITVGTVVAPASRPWTADNAHQPSVYFAPYVVTGDPWDLDMLYAWAGISVSGDAPFPPYVCTTQITTCSNYRGPTGAYGGLFGYNAARDVAWTLRGRAETAFAAPDNTPEKSYFTYMVNDAFAKWEGGLGLTGTPFDAATIKTWVKKTIYPYNWSNLTANVAIGQIPPLGNMASIGMCNSTGSACSYTAATQTSWGLIPGANASTDDPWMNFYLEYAVGRAVELGFAAKQIQAELGQLPIGIIASSQPWFLGAYVLGVTGTNPTGTMGMWPSLEALYAGGEDPNYLAGLKSSWVSNAGNGRQVWMQPGLAMLVDQNAPGASAAWAWYFANGYSLPNAITTHNTDPRWAIVPRTDNNVLPPMPTSIPP
jgi:hypothetical protein